MKKMETKKCSKCGEVKGVEEFGKQADKKDGLSCNCKSCCKKYRDKNTEYKKQYDKEYREQNKERYLLKKKEYYKKNKENVLLKCKEYREINKEKKNKHDREYYKKNTEKIKEYQKIYAENNSDKIKERTKIYAEKNKDKISNYSKENRVTIDGDKYILNSVSDELKPLIKKAIKIKNLKQQMIKLNKDIQNGNS